MSDFVLTQAAKGDLLKILDYLEGDNPSAVLKVVDALDDAMQLLADSPGIGHLRPDLTPQDVRFWSVFKPCDLPSPTRSRLKSFVCCTASVTFDGCSKNEIVAAANRSGQVIDEQTTFRRA